MYTQPPSYESAVTPASKTTAELVEVLTPLDSQPQNRRVQDETTREESTGSASSNGEGCGAADGAVGGLEEHQVRIVPQARNARRVDVDDESTSDDEDDEDDSDNEDPRPRAAHGLAPWDEFLVSHPFPSPQSPRQTTLLTDFPLQFTIRIARTLLHRRRRIHPPRAVRQANADRDQRDVSRDAAQVHRAVCR